jgi:hypothetical protein
MSLVFNNKRIGFNGKRLIASKADEIVPLAALWTTGSNMAYSKNVSGISTNSITITARFNTNNLNITDWHKLSFQLGGGCNSGFVGGVYGQEGSKQVLIDFYPFNTMQRGFVMFGPKSFYTGPESALPKIVAGVANYDNNLYVSAQLQDGGSLSGNHFTFTEPLTSTAYGVYGFNGSPNSGNLYGGSFIRAYNLTDSGFDYSCMAANSQTDFSNGNMRFVVVQ